MLYFKTEEEALAFVARTGYKLYDLGLDARRRWGVQVVVYEEVDWGKPEGNEVW